MADLTDTKNLYMHFHGRVIDHLGIQMYQSPVAAIAEIVSNSWDAEAEIVNISLPEILSETSVIRVADDGMGMTFDDCQNLFLHVGANRRRGNAKSFSPNKNRVELGRKGIGKFAGFGIASKIQIDTISQKTGEHTVFTLDSDELRKGDYISVEQKPIEVTLYEPECESRKENHGTTITLECLLMAQRPSPVVFGRSMARRFLLHQTTQDFSVRVNGTELPVSDELEGAQFVFPRDYSKIDGHAVPRNMTIDQNGWGIESVAGRQIKWRFVFHAKPIADEELNGISVLSHGKLAQSPFFFNITGGVGGQHGMEYLAGRVEADFLDELPDDIISTERQRVSWNDPRAFPILEWGRDRVKALLVIWKGLRGAERVVELTDRVTELGDRLSKLQKRDRRIIEKSLTQIAKVESIDDEMFERVANSFLTAWEGGRLHDLIDDMASAEDLKSEDFVMLLLEAEVLTSIQMAEIVRAKLETVETLRQKVKRGDGENDIRNFIAKSPWLISPKWETFLIEKSVENILREAASEVKFEQEEDWLGRVDLALSSGDSLVILEFMRPNKTIDWDHISRFERYILAIDTRLKVNTGRTLRRVSGGYLVADGLLRNATNTSKISELADKGLLCMDWNEFLANAEAQWAEFRSVLGTRAPDDSRLQNLVSIQEDSDL